MLQAVCENAPRGRVESVGQATDGRAPLAGVETTRLDVIVLDISMPC